VSPGHEALAGGGIADLISAMIRDVRDYPKPGIVFKDITPLLADGAALAAVVGALAAGNGRVDKVAGIEARGFILAAPVAVGLGAGFVPVRKQGKLPAPSIAETYQLEYGTATLEVHEDAFDADDRVLIIDDVLATGGTASDRGPGQAQRRGGRRDRGPAGTRLPERPRTATGPGRTIAARGVTWRAEPAHTSSSADRLCLAGREEHKWRVTW